MNHVKIVSLVIVTGLLGTLCEHDACAQVGGAASSSSSSSTTTEATIKGYAFKYKQRFDNYAEQINMGVTKGWLTAAQADTFRARLSELRTVEAAAGQAGYPDAEIAKLDKMTTKFNEDLSSSSQKVSATTGGAASTSGTTGSKVVTSKSTVKATKKSK